MTNNTETGYIDPNEARKQFVRMTVYNGGTVSCTGDEYKSFLREHLQWYASRLIDFGDPMRAQICLQEVGRLDRQFNFTLT